MSGHFNILKDAGLILAERHGTTIRYRLNVSVADEAIGWLMERVAKDQPQPGEGETE